jgi:hypothetical protein
MILKIGAQRVDVLDEQCADRPCFHLGFDKGSYVPGRGYTSYYKSGPRPVCWTRHMQGCPSNSVCDRCRTVTVLDPGGTCSRQTWSKERGQHECGGTLVPTRDSEGAE